MAEAILPALEGDVVVAESRYELECLDRPVIGSVVAPDTVRIGLNFGFPLAISGRPQGGRQGEELR